MTTKCIACILALLLAFAAPCLAEDRDVVPKYVFFFIGDGMGLSLISLAGYYQGYLSSPQSETTASVPLSFAQFPVTGLMSTHPSDGYVTDSAAAATAMASGHKTHNGMINLSPDEAEAYTPITAYAKAAGMKIGIVTTTHMCDGTPAGFYARSHARSTYYDIAVQAAQSEFIDFFGGGGFREPVDPEGEGMNAYDIARANGYVIVDNATVIRAMAVDDQKTIAIAENLTGKASMQYELDRAYREQFASESLALVDFVSAAIHTLDNENGFMIMAEGGRIDSAAHSGDVKAALWEAIGLSQAVEEAVAFYEEHPEETLIIVTADHETGGFYFTKDLNFDAYRTQDVSNDLISSRMHEIVGEGGGLSDLLSWLERHTGISDSADAPLPLTETEHARLSRALELSLMSSEEREAYPEEMAPFLGYTPYTLTVLDILGERAGIHYPITGHTGTNVPVYALGVGAEAFAGAYDNTMIFHKLVDIMGLRPVQ